ncbi:MAG: flavodoxin-dependent (E)-4-hydroxy-3-methylbut-2-enyl-diphosphate synthase, partial [Bacteroidales bacterium]|nr:flavodoxin-dependent (E)-4-hydroxy-3-methylbut-2-enyl-diphosphate synthase [Bacteroidales bacterium]
MIKNLASFPVRAGNIIIGGNGHISVQTMCNTHTQDIEESLRQCVRMGDAGAELIRLTTQGEPEVEALKEIKKRFRNMGYEIPLVADIHFNADVAIAAASVADKVRINPGNFAREERTATEKLETFLKECKKYGTAVRIGLNHGSLGERITSTYGDTPLGMKEAAMEWLEKCIACNFYNIVISL